MPTLPEPVAELLDRHPLPGDFTVSECFVGSTELAELAVHVVGMIASSPDGRSVSGSAGERETVPFARAYFELFERAALLDAERAPGARTRLNAAGERLVGREPWAFPSVPGDASWRYARSNGVAVGRDFASAARAARAELVERDRLLCAWYGQTQPLRRELTADPAWGALSPWYELEAYEFPASDADDSELSAAAVFGFPKVAEAPLIYGAAADWTLERAIRRAGAEALQRWAFLWGETIPDREPEFAPAADFHQELYLWPAMHARLRDWLAGSHRHSAPALAPRGPRREPPEFVEVGSFPELMAVRAIPDRELPLVFGRGHPNAPHHGREPFLVHPIA